MNLTQLDWGNTERMGTLSKDYITDLKREYSKYEKSIISIDTCPIFKEQFNKYNYHSFCIINRCGNNKLDRPGKFFLYEECVPIDNTNNQTKMRIVYPKLSVYLNTILIDQCSEIECFDVRRTWEKNRKIKTENGYVTFADQESLISRHTQWFNSIMIYGVWDSFPNWKELKVAYDKTFWYYKTKDEKRNIILNNILNGN